MSLREDVIEKAVEFLRDPQTSAAPLEKKVEFLESKSLTKPEIEEAIKRSQDASYTPSARASPASTSQVPEPHSESTASQAQAQQYHQQYYAPAPPPVPERDWKDYFIMATATVGVGYALYEITKRYVLPNILPESKSQLEADKEAIDEEFVRIEATLKEMGEVQKELKDNELKKAEEISSTIESVEELIISTKEKNSKVEEDVKVLKLEVDSLKQSFEKALEKQQSAISSEVANIQHELASLQALIKSKNSLNAELTNGNGIKTSPVPAVSSIPSASEILKKAQLQKSQSAEITPTQRSLSNTPTPVSTAPTSSSIPAWQRELSSSSSTNSTSIPSWQQNMGSSSQSIPSWQQAGQLRANNTSAEDIEAAYAGTQWPGHEEYASEFSSKAPSIKDYVGEDEEEEKEEESKGPVDE